ncbi:uncharacterized protein ACMZJ9_000938 [Mantella aurantiaca]
MPKKICPSASLPQDLREATSEECRDILASDLHPVDVLLKLRFIFGSFGISHYSSDAIRYSSLPVHTTKPGNGESSTKPRQPYNYLIKSSWHHGQLGLPQEFTTSEDSSPAVTSSNVTFTRVTEFIIFGFPSLQKYQLLLFFVFLCIYLFTLSGNGIIFSLVLLDQHLYTPMYFFVGNLSFLDMSYTSVTIPRMLAKFLLKLDTISYAACFAQMYLFLSLGSAECLLLTVMAYDRYLAICSPLHYPTIMTRRLYVLLSAVAWSGGFATPLTATLLALKLPFCGPNIIHHYYCDHPPLLQLACADTSFNVTVGSSTAAFAIVISFILVVISYVKIILAILKISSHDGRKKTFSTCASHFAVVSLFFLPLIFMYVRPTASYSSNVDSLVAMLYTVLTPMMNPIIYSLRNKDIKEAFQKKICYTYIPRLQKQLVTSILFGGIVLPPDLCVFYIMETLNLTSGFILLGFSDLHYNHAALFSTILVIYVLTWTANLLLLSSITLTSQLHTPMYFFLGNLSVVDIFSPTVTIPKLLTSILLERASISFLGCFLQMFLFVFVGTTEVFLLSAMAFDRYLAICIPLRYSLLMNNKVTIMLANSCWVAGSLHSLLHTCIASQLTYCEDRLIHHFFCDLTPLIKLSCSSTALAELLIYIEGSMVTIFPFLFILVSYVLIGWAIVKMKTRSSRSKAFSSCSSHLIVISLFFGTIIFIYIRPPSDYSSQYDRIVSMAYTIITPMLNPFIYSLRNQDVKQALKKLIMQCFFPS